MSLHVNQLIGFGEGPFVPTAGNSFAFLAGYEAVSINTNSHTFTNVGLGAAATNRYIIVTVGAFDNGTVNDGSVNISITIAGVAATVTSVKSYTAGTVNDDAMLAIGFALVPDDITAGSVAVTITNYGGTMDDYFMAVFRATNIVGAFTQTASNAAGDPSITGTGHSFVVALMWDESGAIGALNNSMTSNFTDSTGTSVHGSRVTSSALNTISTSGSEVGGIAASFTYA